MTRKGKGSSLRRRVRCSVRLVIKRTEVTSSTRAAVSMARTIMAGKKRRGRWLTASSIRSRMTSKNFRFSRKPITTIMATRNRMMSRLANSIRWGMSITWPASRSVIPSRAKASRKGQ
jgi:hypothetical protein